jgi:hypothetical protein
VFESRTCEHHSTGGTLDMIQHVRVVGTVLMLSSFGAEGEPDCFRFC